MQRDEACSSNSRAAALPCEIVRVGKKVAGRLLDDIGYTGTREVRA